MRYLLAEARYNEGSQSEGRRSVDHSRFLNLHKECGTARLAYFFETERTVTMLAKCVSEPLTFKERLALAAQGIIENEAHLKYQGMRGLLLDAARLGFESLN
jgi:hypothetical protein